MFKPYYCLCPSLFNYFMIWHFVAFAHFQTHFLTLFECYQFFFDRKHKGTKHLTKFIQTQNSQGSSFYRILTPKIPLVLTPFCTKSCLKNQPSPPLCSPSRIKGEWRTRFQGQKWGLEDIGNTIILNHGELGLVVPACNPSTQEAEAGSSWVQNQPLLHSKTLSQVIIEVPGIIGVHISLVLQEIGMEFGAFPMRLNCFLLRNVLFICCQCIIGINVNLWSPSIQEGGSQWCLGAFSPSYLKKFSENQLANISF
jgi:hypothetical protein